MLCPEVWDFKAPQHNFKVDHSNCQTKKTVSNVINKHYYNHAVTIVLPDTVTLPPKFLENFSQDSDYYRVDGLRVVDLVDKEFVEAFVKRGEVTLLAIGCDVDTCNTLVLTPSGHLILSLLKEDFQKLGLEGKPSFFDLVKTDLKDEHFCPGKKNYERVRRCLSENLDQTFDVIFAWNAPDDKLCPSSIAAWFHKRRYQVKLCRQRLTQRNKYSLAIPIVDSRADNEKLFEWLGLFCVDGELDNSSKNSYVNEYRTPEPSMSVGQACFVQWTGFVTRKQVNEIFQELLLYVRSRPTLPWAAIDIQGFQDSPVSWDLKEHDFYIDGDNSYAIFLKPDGDCVVRTSLSSNNKSRISL